MEQDIEVRSQLATKYTLPQLQEGLFSFAACPLPFLTWKLNQNDLCRFWAISHPPLSVSYPPTDSLSHSP